MVVRETLQLVLLEAREMLLRVLLAPQVTLPVVREMLQLVLLVV